MQNYRNNAMPYNNYRQSASRSSNVPVSVTVERKDTFEDMPLAMAYVPWQRWQNIYDAEQGFCNGTIFQELNLPFYGVGGCQK